MVEIDEGLAMLQHSRMEISVRRCGNRRFFFGGEPQRTNDIGSAAQCGAEAWFQVQRPQA